MPISEADFRTCTGDETRTHSARYDPERPFLFEELAPRYPTRRVRSVFVPMRDGVRLSTDFHVPVGATLPLPVVLVRTPYDKNQPATAMPALLPEQGIVYAIQDVRGRHESEGTFVACTGQDREDGYDTVAWLAAQPWCNGRVGTLGSSYTGETAAKTAAARHSAHRCCVVMFDGSYSGGASLNGAFLQGGISLFRMLFTWFRDYVPAVSFGPPAGVDREAWFTAPYADVYVTQPVHQPEVDVEAQLRRLPVCDVLDETGAAPSDFAEMMRRAADPGDPYWRSQGFLTDADRFDTPAIFVTGPLERGSGFDDFRLFRANAASDAARRHQYLWFTPAGHSAYAGCGPDTRFGARDQGDTRFPYYRRLLDWFGHWLCDAPMDWEQWPRVDYYLQGANRWQAAEDWPPPSTAIRTFHLCKDGGLSVERPTGEGERSFTYDPADPTPSEPPGTPMDTLGGGYADRSAVDGRGDVLAYTSAPLEQPLALAGPVRARLRVSTSARDTDVFAVLSSVDAAGRAINITHGFVRMRWREGFLEAKWCVSETVYEVELDLWHAAIELAAGERLRLTISSSHFPMHERNLNTGGDNFTQTQWTIAHNAVHPGSALVLTVLP